jgi:hypothetical protein
MADSMNKYISMIITVCFIAPIPALSAETIVTVLNDTYQIPKHIKYNPAKKNINDRAIKALKYLCSDTQYKKSEVPDVIMVGPRLWDAIKDLAPITGHPSIPATIMVQIDGEMKELKAGVIRTKERTYYLLKAFKNIIHKSNKIVIRKANGNELSYYWTIIGYDIDEPLYVIELEDSDKYLIHFVDDSKFFYIENICGI